jgi:hypothetical protein
MNSMLEPRIVAVRIHGLILSLHGTPLPPDLYKKAHDCSGIHFRLAVIGFVYGLVVLWLILRWKLAAKLVSSCSQHAEYYTFEFFVRARNFKTLGGSGFRIEVSPTMGIT